MSSQFMSSYSQRNNKRSFSPIVMSSTSSLHNSQAKQQTSGTSKTNIPKSKFVRDISPFRKYTAKKPLTIKKSKPNVFPSKKQISIEGDLMNGPKSQPKLTIYKSPNSIAKNNSKLNLKPKISSSNPFLAKRSKSQLKSNNTTKTTPNRSPIFSPYSEVNGKSQSKTPPRKGLNLGLNKSNKSPAFGFSQTSKTPSIRNRKINIGGLSSKNKIGMLNSGNISTKSKPRSFTPIPKSKISLTKNTTKKPFGSTSPFGINRK